MEGYRRSTALANFGEPPIAAGLKYEFQSQEFRDMREQMLVDVVYDEQDAQNALTSIRLSGCAADDVRLATTWLTTKGARQEQLTRF